MKLASFVNYLKRKPLAVKTYHALKRALMSSRGFEVPEIWPLNARKGTESEKLRLTFLPRRWIRLTFLAGSRQRFGFLRR